MSKTNKIYKILCGDSKIMDSTLVLYKNNPKTVLNKTIDFAKENNLELVTITDNTLKIHQLLAGGEYDKLLRENITIYGYDYQKTFNTINFLNEHNHSYLISDLLVKGNFKNIVSNIEDLNKIGDIVLDKNGVQRVTLNYLIDNYCPTVYIKGRNIENTFNFLNSVNLLSVLIKAPSILINVTETIKDIYNFLKSENRIDIIINYPAVLLATDINRVKEMYKYGKENDCLDKCVTMLTYCDNNVFINDRLLKEYGINKFVATSILKNNPNKLADILDDFIEKEAYAGLKNRRTILNTSYEKLEERTAFFKANNHPIQIECDEKINPKIFAPQKEWDKYKLELYKTGFEEKLPVEPITLEKSNILKKQYVPSVFLDDYIKNTDIRNMELNDEIINKVDYYINALDILYGVKKSDIQLEPLIYNVNGLIISRNKVRRNLAKIFYNDNQIDDLKKEVIIASIFGISRYNEKEMENIVSSIESISLEQDDIKKTKCK